jgi:hypothetical protein
VSDLERAAEAWIADHALARHLLRTRDWVLELDRFAGEDLRLAALTHDVERRFPGGPTLDPRKQRWDDPGYLAAHSRRSAAIVDEWLASEGANAELRASVFRLVCAHEIGGWPEADLLQAADSLAFLEVNTHRVIAWVDEGRCDVPKAHAKLDLMLERISVPAALPIGAALHAKAATTLEEKFRMVPARRSAQR